MSTPDISVVMSVYNNQASLPKTIESILSQQGVNFEFIIVNDGSNDGSLAIVESYVERDPRVRLISHDNVGLTKSLIVGCKQAKGCFIARQDCGDISLQGRLLRQLTILENNSETCMVSSTTEFVTPNNEHLYTISQNADSARYGLKTTNPKKIQGPPHHGSVMFRRSLYEEVGGYRKEFLVAQDIDLWTRLVEHGDHESLSEILYQAVVEKDSISSTKRDQQLTTAQYIVECMKAREQNASQAPILDKLRRYNATVPKAVQSKNKSDSNYYYYIGSSLIKTAPKASKRYFLKAVKSNPLNWRALAKLIRLMTPRN